MTFIRNPLYSGTAPTLAKVTCKLITDPNVALAAYKNNELNISMVPAGTEEAIIADPTLSPQILRYSQLTTLGFLFNVTKTPFDNKLLRQAFSTAIDRNAFIDQTRGGIGHPATSWIPPGMPGYDPNLGSQYTFNATIARQLLAQAGYPNGVGLPELRYQYFNTPSNAVIALFLQNQLQTNLGINLTLQPMMNQQEYNSFVNNKQFDSCWWGWGVDYPDPENMLPNIFGTNGGANRSGYSNTQFDQLAASASHEMDNTTRLALWAQAQATMVDDAPMVFIYNRATFALKKPWVEGLLTTGMDYSGIPGEMFFSNIHVSTSSIVSISPSSIAAGSPSFTITVNGIGFLPGYTIRWCDANGPVDLVTTFVSASQLTATIPVDLVSTARTADIYLVQNNTQVSNLLPLFVTEANTQVSSSSSGTSNTPSGMVTVSTGGTGPSTPGSVTASAIGTGTTAVAQFASNPGGLPTFESAGSYFDVHASHDSNITDLTVVVGSLNGGNVAYWWNGTQWVAASNQTYDPALSTITIHVTSSTLPSLSDLEGCIFGIAKPTLGVLNLPVDPVAITTMIGGCASFTDPDSADTHTGIWNWGDGTTSAATIIETNGNGTAEGNYNYTEAGVYEVILIVTGSRGASVQSMFQYVVIYDPSAGFVTGGGWIDSPAGAYVTKPTTEGKANFGFVSRYQKGANVPEGNTEFQFKAGDLNFKSTSYQWLVVAGTKAQFKGEGTINGEGIFKFMLTAEDNSPDTFRIKIWTENTSGTETVIYDNGSQQVLGGGSIVIHK